MKQEILIWKIFDQRVCHDLKQAQNVKEKRAIFSEALGLQKRDWKNGEEKSEILLDAFANCYNFALGKGFSVQSTSGIWASLRF